MPEEEKEKKKEERNNGVGMMFMMLIIIILIIAFFSMLVMYLIERTEDTDQIGNIFIYDLDGADWADDEDLPIFYNEEFGSEKVAPYSSGTYRFMFQNLSEFSLEYKIELTEENEYDIAMCYRLKRDGDYVVDDYTRASEFTCESITIEGNSTQYFELEWYWDGDVNDVKDTLAGVSGSIYELTIALSATAA